MSGPAGHLGKRETKKGREGKKEIEPVRVTETERDSVEERER